MIADDTYRLPDIEKELDMLLENTESAIKQLPPPPPKEPVAEVLRMTGSFIRDIIKIAVGTPDPNGMLQILRPAQNIFSHAIRKTAPVFKPKDRTYNELLAPNFLSTIERDDFFPEEDVGVMTFEKVLEIAKA